MTASTVLLSHRGAFIVACVLVALCYANSLPNDFVFDDGPIVASNPAIRTIDPVRFLKSPYWSQQQYEGIYRPFTIFSLAVEYRIWQRWAPGFRLTNLAAHAVNGFLLFLLCTTLIGEGIVPWAAMVIYIVHPVHTEAVTTIVGRSDLFATGFLLSAWLLFRRGRTLWSAVLFGLALLSKENAIVFPAVLMLETWLSRARGASGTILASGVSPWNENADAVQSRRDDTSAELYRPDGAEPLSGNIVHGLTPVARIVSPLPGLAIIGTIAAGYLTLRFSVLGGLGIPVSAQYMGGHLTYLERLMTSGRVFLEYLKLTFFPINVPGDYDFNAIPIAHLSSWDAWLGLLMTAAIIIGAFLFRRRNWVLSFGILFAFVVFIPASNWIMPISILMAERFLYLPLIGLSMVAAIIITSVHDARLRRLIAIGGLAVAVVLCNSHDYIRRNEFTFFANMARLEPNSAKARLGYGYALLKAGRNDEAAQQLEAGLQIIPDYPELLTTLAMTKTTPKDCDRAWPLLRRALAIDPAHADTHRRMGDCYFKEGKVQEAESMYRQAVESIPYPDSMLYFMWGRTLESTGQKESAITAYERAALIDPQNAFIKEKLNNLR